MKIQKKKFGGGGSGLGRGQGGCEWRSEAFVKIQIVFVWFLWGEVGSGGGGGGGGSGWGVREDGNGEVKLL